jgi:hypothetical protein
MLDLVNTVADSISDLLSLTPERVSMIVYKSTNVTVSPPPVDSWNFQHLVALLRRGCKRFLHTHSHHNTSFVDDSSVPRDAGTNFLPLASSIKD